VAPRRVVNGLDLYTRWVGQLGSGRHTDLAGTLARRWMWQMALNVALIAAVFLAAVFVGQRPPAWVRELGLGDEGIAAGLWLAAVILSLPMFVATSRKLQALGLLLAETKVTRVAAGERTAVIQAVVAQAIPIAGMAMLALFALVLSSALLPTFKVLILLLVVAGGITWLLRRSFIKIYSKAQVSLKEILTQPPPLRPGNTPLALPSVLRDADLESVLISRNSPAAGKLIRELALRTKTGASVVAIDRPGASIINPGPDEELQAGDRLLLIGSRAQLDAAKTHLSTAD
jgi:CPA2 family monovalent cation:H+ antiporter-2